MLHSNKAESTALDLVQQLLEYTYASSTTPAASHQPPSLFPDIDSMLLSTEHGIATLAHALYLEAYATFAKSPTGTSAIEIKPQHVHAIFHALCHIDLADQRELPLALMRVACIVGAPPKVEQQVLNHLRMYACSTPLGTKQQIEPRHSLYRYHLIVR
jgi:hypothetical protein